MLVLGKLLACRVIHRKRQVLYTKFGVKYAKIVISNQIIQEGKINFIISSRYIVTVNLAQNIDMLIFHSPEQ